MQFSSCFTAIPTDAESESVQLQHPEHSETFSSFWGFCISVSVCQPAHLSVCLSACLSVTVFTKLIDLPVHSHGKLIFCRLLMCALDKQRETTRLKLFCYAQVVISHGLCSVLICSSSLFSVHCVPTVWNCSYSPLYCLEL